MWSILNLILELKLSDCVKGFWIFIRSCYGRPPLRRELLIAFINLFLVEIHSANP